MPAAAAGTSEQVSSANAEQGPDYYESVSQKASVAKKSSILPIILIGVGVLTITALVVILLVLKSYDITGTWTVNYTWSGWPTGSANITFTGTKKSGTFATQSYTGTYTVDGKNVVFTYTSGTKYTGTFTAKETMSGTMVSWDGDPGTWTATKNAGSASTPQGRDSSGATTK
jgi:hypothetical protein